MFAPARELMTGLGGTAVVYPSPAGHHTWSERDMTTRDVLLKEIQQVSGPLLQEVLNFIRFMQGRLALGRFERAVASEPSLSTDWLAREEKAARHFCLKGDEFVVPFPF